MIPFVIDHLDPMGQGVSRRSVVNKKTTISFIPKTLPGEQGKARVIKSSKGVEFAILESLQQVSHQRIEPECPHYSTCSGCDYLHVSYEDEIKYKKAALSFLLRALPISNIEIEVQAAESRFHYRNRVQLHYRHKYLGLINAVSDQVLEVPECRLVNPLLHEKMQALYADKDWSKHYTGRGHVELYERGGQVVEEWNQPYASGGFTQVNSAMNNQLGQYLGNYLATKTFKTLLDLFAGDGNLSSQFLKNGTVNRQMIDFSPWMSGEKPDEYFQMDLYAEDALSRYGRKSAVKAFDLLLLDPPRKGFSLLGQWVDRFKPETIVYVSCNPATLARDLQILFQSGRKMKYKMEKILMLDMFPGTRHFETVVLLSA